MDKRRLVAFAIIAAAGLGFAFLFAGQQTVAPDLLQTFQAASFKKQPCTSQPVIAGLTKAASPDLQRLAAYQALCSSGVTKTLAIHNAADAAEFAAFGVTPFAESAMASQPVAWVKIESSSDDPAYVRTAALQKATNEALRRQNESKHTGIYLLAGGNNSFFGRDEQILRDFISKWYRAGLRLAISDNGALGKDGK